MRSVMLPSLLFSALTLGAAACGSEPITTAEQCEDAGYFLRPASEERGECRTNETEVAYVSLGTEGACCRPNSIQAGGY